MKRKHRKNGKTKRGKKERRRAKKTTISWRKAKMVGEMEDNERKTINNRFNESNNKNSDKFYRPARNFTWSKKKTCGWIFIYKQRIGINK